MTTTEDNNWRTSEMSLVAYLIGRGVEPLHSRWEEGARRKSCYWYFDDTEELADLVSEFHGGQAAVDPVRYSEIIRMLKADMFSNEPGGRASYNT